MFYIRSFSTFFRPILLKSDIFAYLCEKLKRMNDYYQVKFTLTPSSQDACDLLADSLGNIGYESFVDDDDKPGASLTAYVPAPLYSAETTSQALEDLPEGFKAVFEAEFVPGQDWNAEWEKNYFKPIVVDDKVVVSSTFHTDVPKAKISILINPKMAFGTGHHATTVLMMKSLLAGGCPGANVVDMGTGTGILAILARKLGATKALAVEIDAFAVENTAENISLNLPDPSGIELVHGDASALDGRPADTDIFLANINRNIITADVDRYAKVIRQGGRLTVSGFYVADRPIVEEAANKAGLTLRSVADLDNWSSMTFEKL